MRSVECTNSLGISITFDEGSSPYGITSLEGLGVPDINEQEQKAPYQDGTTHIDQLLKPRDIVLEGTIKDGQDHYARYQHRRQLVAAINPKLGPLSIIYTNDYGSWAITGVAEGPIFANKNANEGNQKFQVTFYCHDPRWMDINDTIVTVMSTSANLNINIIGDTPVPVKVDITGSGINPSISERIQNKHISFNSPMNQLLEINTGFGIKGATLHNANALYIKVLNYLALTTISYSSYLGQWCALGGKVIYLSVDGINWSIQNSGAANNLEAISYSVLLNLWIAVGDLGTIITSPDGINWTNQSSGSSSNLSAIIATGKLLVAVGYTGTILTSSNGTSWTSRTSGTTNNLNGVSYASSLWCAVGDSGTILTSSNGTSWTVQTSGVTNDLQAVAYSSALGQWCVVGHTKSSVNAILISTNSGVTWTNKDTGYTHGLHYSFSDVVYSGVWVAIGGSSAGVYTSSDGLTWTSVASTNILKIAASSSQFVSINGGTIYISSNAISWEAVTIPITTVLGTSIKYSTELGLWIASGDDSIIPVGVFLSSRDMVSWTEHSSGIAPNLLTDVAYSPLLNQYMLVGRSNTITLSNDGIHWSGSGIVLPGGLSGFDFLSVSWSIPLSMWAIACYSASSGGKILTSKDGLNWIIAYTAVNSFNGITYSADGGKWIAVGNGQIATSNDGVSWSLIIVYGNMLSVEYSAILKQWCAVGSTGVIFTSTDAVTWTSRASGSTDNLNKVIYNTILDEWNVIGNNSILTSYDGINWSINTSMGGFSIASNTADTIIFTGNGTILDYTIGTGTNVINQISQDSDFTLALNPGNNLVSLTCSGGSFIAAITYRNRYVGI